MKLTIKTTSKRQRNMRVIDNDDDVRLVEFTRDKTACRASVVIESPTSLTCRQTCPFPKLLQTLKDENPTNSSLKMTIMPPVALQRLRKLE
jgi:hypothetical protein